MRRLENALPCSECAVPRPAITSGPGEVHLRVDAEGGTVHWLVALDHVALVIDQDQVRDLDLAEVHSERD